MMMDDIFFEDPTQCQDCLKKIETGISIWINGRCTCPDCYEKKRRKLDQQRGEEE